MKRKKFSRTVSGRVKARSSGKKTAKRTCSHCGVMLHGMPHGLQASKAKALGKSKRRPSAIFAGVLCSKCRRKAMDEAIMVKQNSKSPAGVDLSMKAFVEKAMEKLG